MPFSAKNYAPIAVTDIVGLVTGPANQKCLLGTVDRSFLFARNVHSWLITLFRKNYLVWTETFSYTVLSSVQVL